MNLMIFYSVIFIAIILLLFYFSGIKEGILRLLMILIIALSWLSIERIIERNDVNWVTIVLFSIAISLIIIFLWLRKKFVSEEKPKNRKKKKLNYM